jgi:hypothetical protein
MKALLLKSYDNWFVAFMNPEEMAAAGLYSTCNDDMVRCPFCKAVMGDWMQDGDTFHRHKCLRPNCIFVCERVSTDFDTPVDEGVCDYKIL